MGLAVVCFILACVGLIVMTAVGAPASAFVVPAVVTGVLGVAMVMSS
jgi:hypothetical protein